MDFKIEWVGTPNFKQGRNRRKPIAIVNHITAGSMPGTLSWLTNPQAQASSNYLITRDGRIIQLVKDENTAWANGSVKKPNWKLYDGTNPNYYTISIEHEGYYTYKDKTRTIIKGNFGGDGSLTEIQYQATFWLHKYLINKWNIPIDDEHIIGHFKIDSVDRPNCPGENFPWDRLFNDLKNTREDYLMKPEDANKIISVLGAFYNLIIEQKDKDELHRLANELRKASGQKET